MLTFWQALPALVQDILIALAMIAPGAGIGLGLCRGFNPWPLASAMLGRYRWINAVFVVLIAIAVGMGMALTAQEKGLRIGAAKSADKFDLVIAAPGSPTQMMLATVFLDPSDAPLLSGATFARIASHPGVAMAAPLAFGDSYEGHPIVGTTLEFLMHLSDGKITGAPFQGTFEAVVGSAVPLSVGDHLEPAHGTGDSADEHAHEDEILVVGRMAPTGTPWDKAVILPIETVWDIHGLANGHEGEQPVIGQPFDPDLFPGTPAVIVKADSLAGTYALRSEFNRGGTMAFFPGTVLSDLYRIVGDVRAAVSSIITVTQILVAISVLCALFILARLFQRQIAVLRALGAPARFNAAVIWCYAASLVLSGSLAGLGLGWIGAEVVAGLVSQRMDMSVPIAITWTEVHGVLGFASIASTLSIVPAWLNLKLGVVQYLRG